MIAIENARLFEREWQVEDKGRQLATASQHKSAFLANMSHELRTPLNAIIGFSELLAKGYSAGSARTRLVTAGTFWRSGSTCSRSSTPCSISRRSRPPDELELGDFALPGAVDNALTLVRERSGRRGSPSQRGRHRPGMIGADERKVKQVLLNLLSNALKFTPEGGRVEVRATG